MHENSGIRKMKKFSYHFFCAAITFFAANTEANLNPAAYDAFLDGKQKAFPSAEGFGKWAQGGRGGEVYYVTNLNDSGEGSLRACVEASGPRTCIFSVAGIIAIDRPIKVLNPFLTIAGQTSPGGIIVRNGLNTKATFAINADHVIVRHMSFMSGPPDVESSSVDAAQVGVGAQNVILDHVTMAWGTDETLNIYGSGAIRNGLPNVNAGNITIQWSMIYESLEYANHPKGAHSRSTFFDNGIQDFTVHHSFIANSNRRNPNIQGLGQVDFINNVIHGHGEYAGELYTLYGTQYQNWIGNIVTRGEATPWRDNIFAFDVFENNDLSEFHGYVKDNLDVHRPTNTGDERLVADPKDWSMLTVDPVGYGELSLPVTEITGPEQAYNDVLTYAGSNPLNRHASDMRVTAWALQCLGDIIDSPDEVGGYPVITQGAPYPDADQDGMDDQWELSNNLNPEDPSDRNGDIRNKGYTNLEYWLNQLAGDVLPDGDPSWSYVGEAEGPDPIPSCGYFVNPKNAAEIRTFAVSARALRPGDELTITWDAYAETCTRNWDPDGGYALSGTDVVTVDEDMNRSFELICKYKGSFDWNSHYVYINDVGEVPAPDLVFTSDKVEATYGELVTLTWQTNDNPEPLAGECIASGAWNGFKPIAGKEIFSAKNSGDYILTCAGPGGTAVESIEISVSE